MMLYKLLFKYSIRVPVLVLALLLNIVHPLIHGTVLDAGWVDQLIYQLDMIAMYYLNDTGTK